jgi:hypothetical protein
LGVRPAIRHTKMIVIADDLRYHWATLHLYLADRILSGSCTI